VSQASPPIGGPVSEVLEADLRTWVRKHGIVVWLDLDGHYTSLVDRLVAVRASGRLPYEVKAFRGSHLDLMLSLEGLVGGAEKTSLVVHLPGFNEDTVRQTPSLELYSAGVRYRKSLDTLVNEAAGGRVRPEQIAAFQAAGALTLEGADAWLEAVLEEGDSGAGARLRGMHPGALLDELLGGGLVAQEVAQGHVSGVWERLRVATGLSTEWIERTLPSERNGPSDVAFAAASWCLGVEYVDDLRRPPVAALLAGAAQLPRAVIDACRAVAAQLRARHSDFYKRTADETEALLDDEVDAVKAEDLGSIDTFRFEEDTLLRAALARLASQAFEVAADWASLRIGSKASGGSYWLREDPTRQSAWQLIADAAALGLAMARAGEHLNAKGGTDTAVDAYMERGAAVDQAHRHLEQRRLALLYPQLPQFEELRARLDGMRGLWRVWADQWARDFNGLCRTHGFLPEPGRQQRMLFDEVVKPMAQEAGTTAYFVVDALRFEMGEELYRQMATESSTTVHLKGRLAELPSVTEVGMNVLAPVVRNGRLSPSLTEPNGGKVDGFSTGEFRVFDPETRRRAMHGRVGGASCPWLKLEEVVSRDSTSLARAVAQARLLVVHSEEIDKAGENGVGPAVFDHVMQKLLAAWHLLREAGVRRFVLTSDHGFLLLDESAGSTISHGRKIDPKRRHVFSAHAADHSGEARVPLSALGYEGVAGHVMFPETTAVFDTGRRSMSFVHGGNSLQERVIPVLTVVHRAAAGGSTVRYTVSASALDGVGGMHCIAGLVTLADQHSFDFGGPKELELELRVPELEDVRVELCQVRGKARLVAGAVWVAVAESFELFFRLIGSTADRVQVELFHGSPRFDVTPCVPDARFAVAAERGPSTPPPLPAPIGAASKAPAAPPMAWLLDLPEGGERQVFEHLAAHGAVTEEEAAAMLGGPRAARRFALRFEEFARKAPFGVRIDVVAGAKRYVREGNNS
jgi:hypothetical protein